MIMKVALKNKSIDISGITKDYREAICEFIWNGFEANATEIVISFETNSLDGIDSLSISDNGDGIVFENLDETFGTFLASTKSSLSLKPKTKINKGKGRFSFASFSNHAEWVSVYKDGSDYWKFGINLNCNNKEQFEYSNKEQISKTKTGTTVIFTNISALLPEQVSIKTIGDFLLREFAWFLFLNKKEKFSIILNNEKLDYSQYIDTSLSMETTITIKRNKFKVHLVVWSDKINESFCCYYFDSKRQLKEKKTTSFNHNAVDFNHSVYVYSNFFDNISGFSFDADENEITFDTSENDKIIIELKKRIKRLIEQKLSEYMAGKADDEVDKMINQRKTFPTFDENDKYEQIKKTDLIEVTKSLYRIEPRLFYKLKDVQERTLLNFLKLLLNSEERENLLSIISEIVELTKEQRADFASMLKRTSLENIINTVKYIKSRYEVIEALKAIVYDYDKYANERDNIQKIIEQHFWIFGDEYYLASADVAMQKALDGYSNILYYGNHKNVKLDNEIEANRRMDIFLCASRYIDASYGAYTDENIIVELKAPKITLNIEILRQIEDYMNFIVKNTNFNGTTRNWKFISVCKSVNEDVMSKYESLKDRGKTGLVLQMRNYEIYAFTWDDIFRIFENRHRFILQKLDFNYHNLIEEELGHPLSQGKKGVEELMKLVNSKKMD